MRATVKRVAPNTYLILVNREPIGTVDRTGTLRSCIRWWSFDADGAKVGLTRRTRAEAVEQLIEHVSSA